MADQFDSLAPRDILITLRSLERRLGGVIGQVRSDPDLFGQIDSKDGSGASFASLASDGALQVAGLASGLEVAAKATRKLASSDFNAGASGDRLAVEAAQELVGSSATALADALESISADDWSATVSVEGSGDHSVVDLAREVARRGIGTLRRLESRKDEMG